MSYAFAEILMKPIVESQDFKIMERPARQRLWRLRKLHQYADAELHETPGTRAAEVRFFYNGELSYARACPTLELALAEAAAKREELEREGWMFHW
jgi:hypothetical protein